LEALHDLVKMGKHQGTYYPGQQPAIIDQEL
jgi:hypothetical protein